MYTNDQLSYDVMEEAVAALCHSLENEPDRWRIESATLIDQQTGIQYWTYDSKPITDAWVDGGKHKVFSEEQGKRVAASYRKMREARSTEIQQRVLDSLRVEEEEKKKKGGRVTLGSLFRRFFPWLCR